MKYLQFFFMFVFYTNYSQCNQETNVEYYNSDNLAFSNSKKVSVTFGNGLEVSNFYNYLDPESLYCVIYGFDKTYLVKLFTSYNNKYTTSCTAINSIFSNGYVKGKDQEGRIWKIFKSNNSSYDNQSYDRPERTYSPVTSSINTEEIRRGLSSLQQKIDKNRSLVNSQRDAAQYKLDILKYKIEKLNNPSLLLSLRKEIVENLNFCVEGVDFGSNSSTDATLSCTNSQLAKLAILEMKINDFRVNDKLTTQRNEKGYLFKTTFVSTISKPNLREEPDINSRVVYECPKDAEVIVVDNSGDLFFKIIVNGYSGYITKHYLKRTF